MSPLRAVHCIPTMSKRAWYRPAMAKQVVVLLRGINVGGRAKLPMATLRSIAEDLGFADPTTYLQSGNLVVGTDHAVDKVAEMLRDGISSETGLDIAVLTRTFSELQGVIEHNPFPDQAVDGKLVHVAFLDAKPDKALKDFDATDFAPEELVLGDRHVWLSLPGGIGRSKLATALGRVPSFKAATVRNWNTVTALAEMAD